MCFIMEVNDSNLNNPYSLRVRFRLKEKLILNLEYSTNYNF